MINKLEQYRKIIYFGILFIALGVIFTSQQKSIGSTGTVFMAIGVLFIIRGMVVRRKQKDNEFNI